MVRGHVLETSEPPNCPLVYPARTLRGADTRHPRKRRHRLTQLVLTQIPTDTKIRKDTKIINRGRKNDPKHPKSIALDSQNDPPNKTIRLPGHRGNTILPVPKSTCQRVTKAKCHLFVNCAYIVSVLCSTSYLVFFFRGPPGSRLNLIGESAPRRETSVSIYSIFIFIFLSRTSFGLRE